MNRRSFITGMAGILAASQAPAIVRASIIMPVRQIIRPDEFLVRYEQTIIIDQMRAQFAPLTANQRKAWGLALFRAAEPADYFAKRFDDLLYEAMRVENLE